MTKKDTEGRNWGWVEEGNISHVHSLAEFIIATVAILTKIIYRFSATHIKIPITFSTEPGKPILKLIWKQKRHPITKQS